jgi:hypothetical protein
MGPPSADQHLAGSSCAAGRVIGHLRWEYEMGRYGLVIPLLPALGAIALADCAPQATVTSSRAQIRSGNGAGLIFSGLGFAERPRFCLRGSTDNLREWHTDR